MCELFARLNASILSGGERMKCPFIEECEKKVRFHEFLIRCWNNPIDCGLYCDKKGATKLRPREWVKKL